MGRKDKDLPEEGAGSAPDAGPAREGPEASPAGEAGDELSELRSRYAYLAAEFDNFRKRVAREKESLVAFGNERLLRAILPVLDNLERAMAHEGAGPAAEAILSGVRMTYDLLLAELRKFGLEPVAAAGAVFDPNRHEAVARVPWDGKPEGTVLTEERKGYLLHGRLLRPAQVTVAIRRAGAGTGEGDGPDTAGRDA